MHYISILSSSKEDSMHIYTERERDGQTDREKQISYYFISENANLTR